MFLLAPEHQPSRKSFSVSTTGKNITFKRSAGKRRTANLSLRVCTDDSAGRRLVEFGISFEAANHVLVRLRLSERGLVQFLELLRTSVTGTRL